MSDTSTLHRLEQKIQVKLNESKSFIEKIYMHLIPYLNAIQSTMQTLWHPEFRLSLYIFGILSFIPVAIFLISMSVIILTTSIVLCVIWSIIVFSTAALGLIILIPILLSFSLIVIFLIISHDVYQHLLRLKKTSK
ncbi:hypothetical protein MFLAVUS_000082 [Mucor flavus]|uniref:Uncharacterized protein n=1 Tax=Mucor flavus TaxID=439312 RepID=A0ABP9YIP3_9FUNG